MVMSLIIKESFMLKISKDQAASFYQTMCNIRCFEEAIEKNFLAGKIPGFVHLYIGEEAIATGICGALRRTDYIESTHRGHGHCIAKGANINRMMAEIFGKREGLCKGKGGSMHIADFSVGMLGANGVVGGGYNLAAGAAFATKMQGKDNVSVVFFGDGASNRGTFHEAANMAAIWKLPVIFVCEMNCWASTTPYRTTSSVENISDRAQGYQMPCEIVNGNDVEEVYKAACKAVDRARNGEGPTFIECKTYRIKGHFVGDPEMYRTRAEVKKVFDETDPLKKFREKYSSAGMFTEDELAAMMQKAKKTIEDALEYAEKGNYPSESELYVDLYK
jgi:pyruvate dehydrogenase E1 component alpha subunit